MKETLFHLVDKIKYYWQEALIIFFTFIAPIKLILFLCGSVIFADLFFGIWKSKKLNRRITSRGLAETVKKMFVYQMVIITMFFLDTALLGDFIAIFTDIEFAATKAVALSLILVELYSINENVELIWNINIFKRIKDSTFKLFTIKKQFDKYQD